MVVSVMNYSVNNEIANYLIILKERNNYFNLLIFLLIDAGDE